MAATLEERHIQQVVRNNGESSPRKEGGVLIQYLARLDPREMPAGEVDPVLCVELTNIEVLLPKDAVSLPDHVD